MLVNQRTALRRILAEKLAVKTASVSCPLSVRAAAALDYEVAMLAGSVAALEVLGAPDLTLLSLSDLADQARRLARVADMPILVDADHGYGNALNVMRTIEELSCAGVAGVTIEDTALPKTFGQGETTELISLEEGVGKLRAALRARRDPQFVISARTSSVRIAGVEEAVRRARAYADTGVDALFLSGIDSVDQLRAIAREVSLPIILGAAGPELSDEALLRDIGVRIWVQGHQPVVAAIHAMHETYARMMGEGLNGEMKSLSKDALISALTRHSDYLAWMQAYMAAPRAE